MIDVWRVARRWEPRHKSPRPDRRGRLSLLGFVGCTTLLTATFTCTMLREQEGSFLPMLVSALDACS